MVAESTFWKPPNHSSVVRERERHFQVAVAKYSVSSILFLYSVLNRKTKRTSFQGLKYFYFSLTNTSPYFIYWGDEYLPRKRMDLVLLCLMKKRKGWSAVKCSSLSIQRTAMPAVAAAASVPSSFTSTKALWATVDRKSPPSPFIPDKSASPAQNTSVMPSLARALLIS